MVKMCLEHGEWVYGVGRCWIYLQIWSDIYLVVVCFNMWVGFNKRNTSMNNHPWFPAVFSTACHIKNLFKRTYLFQNLHNPTTRHVDEVLCAAPNQLLHRNAHSPHSRPPTPSQPPHTDPTLATANAIILTQSPHHNPYSFV